MRARSGASGKEKSCNASMAVFGGRERLDTLAASACWRRRMHSGLARRGFAKPWAGGQAGGEACSAIACPIMSSSLIIRPWPRRGDRLALRASGELLESARVRAELARSRSRPLAHRVLALRDRSHQDSCTAGQTRPPQQTVFQELRARPRSAGPNCSIPAVGAWAVAGSALRRSIAMSPVGWTCSDVVAYLPALSLGVALRFSPRIDSPTARCSHGIR